MIDLAQMDNGQALAVEALLDCGCAGESHAPENDSAAVAKGLIEAFKAFPLDSRPPAEKAHSAQPAPDIFEAHEDVLFSDGARAGLSIRGQSFADFCFERSQGPREEQAVSEKQEMGDGSICALGNELRQHAAAH